MKDTITAENIQGWLDRNGPCVPLTNKPLFRLVWSDDEYEKRIGTFRVYYGSVFVREETKLELVRKYNYINQRWILEKWFPPELSYTEEVPDSVNGLYECIYAFDNHGQMLPLNLEVVQFLVKIYSNKKSNELYRKSHSLAMKDAAEDRNYNMDLDILSDEGPLVSQFHDGSAIILPGKDFSQKDFSQQGFSQQGDKDAS